MSSVGTPDPNSGWLSDDELAEVRRRLPLLYVEAVPVRVDGMGVAYAEPNARRRIDTIIKHALSLPHGAEAAIRVWSSLDQDVLAVQQEVDKRRYDVMFDAAFEILGHANQAQVFASWSMYLLIGYEQATLPRDTVGLRWVAAQMLDALDSGRFASVPDD
jgi:hypothetical protein